MDLAQGHGASAGAGESAGGPVIRRRGVGAVVRRAEMGAPTRWLSRHGGWLALALSVSVYVVLAVLEPPHVGLRSPGYFDLRVYRGAAALILEGRSLYDTRILEGYHFTYPPFAALVLTPLLVVPLAVDEVGITAVNVTALVGLLWLALRIRNSSSGKRKRAISGDQRGWPLAALAAAAALWLAPVWTTLGYGQIDLVIATLIVFDIGRPDAARTKGAAIGLASGMKLTPMIFVPYLLLTGRRRAALVATGVFAGTVAAGFALLPSDAARYWDGIFLDSSRVGSIAASANQSLQGAAARLIGVHSLDPEWVAGAAIVALAGFTVAVLASRRGDEATGFSMCAITGLLASPISWTHHWALAVPALFLLSVGAYESRSRLLLTAAMGIALIGYAYTPESISLQGLHPSWGTLLAADPYVLIGILAIAAGATAQRWASRRGSVSGQP